MGYIIAELEEVPEGYEFYITFTGQPFFDGTFSRIAVDLGRRSAIINLYGDASRGIKNKMKQKSDNLSEYLERNANIRGIHDILYVTSKRADLFGDDDFGVAICHDGMDKSFNQKCLRLPTLLKAILHDYRERILDLNISQNQELWNELLNDVRELFGNGVFPIGNYAGGVHRIL